MRLRPLKERIPNRFDIRVFAGYVLAAAVYVAIGVAVTDFLLSFWVGVAYIVVAAWAVPTIVRRPRRRLRRHQDARALPVRPSETTGRHAVRQKGGT
jgi:membrane protein implicated in regulation of membrane protease activity